MKIGIINQYSKIDNNKRKAYNKRLYNSKSFGSDFFCLSNNKMNKDELNKIINSKFLANSMVDFIPDIVNDYFDKKLSKDEFATTYISKLNKVKFYLSQMKPELIKENQTVCINELRLADNINKLAKKAEELDETTFNKNLTQAITDYNKIYQEDI